MHYSFNPGNMNPYFRPRIIIKRLILISLFISCFFGNILLSHSQQVHYVSNAADSGEGTLRNILQQSQHGDTIRFVEGIDTVYLTSDELLISKSFSILGNPEMITILRLPLSTQFRIMRVVSDDSLVINLRNIIISGGHAQDGNNASVKGEDGGGIYISQNYHKLFLTDCIIAGNKAGDGFRSSSPYSGGNGGDGGGIYSNSYVFLENCGISDNSTGIGVAWWTQGDYYSVYGTNGGSGAGIYSTHDLKMLNCQFKDNIAQPGGSCSCYNHYCNYSDAGDGGSGGGVYCINGKVEMTGCGFENNIAGSGGNASDMYGSLGGEAGMGGAGCFLNGEVLIDNSSFINNSSGNGGSAIAESTFATSRSGGNGGAVYFQGNKFDIRNSSLTNNVCGNGGSGEYYCFWVGNGGSGGGVYLEGNEVKLENCNITGNQGGKGGDFWGYGPEYGGSDGGSGGGLMMNAIKDSLVVKSCLIRNNSSGDGGKSGWADFYYEKIGMYGGDGGGICITGTPERSYIINSEISSNRTGRCYSYSEAHYWQGIYPRAGNGGGLCVDSSEVFLVNITCAGNKTGLSKMDGFPIPPEDTLFHNTIGHGGGMYNQGGHSEIINSLFADNLLADTLISNDIEGNVFFDYSFLKDSSNCTITGQNNIYNSEPFFKHFPDSLLLTAASMAIDRGSPDTTGLFIPVTDLSGNPRIFNNIVDIGAFEFQENTYQSYEISPDSIIFNPILPGGFSIDSVSVINDGFQLITFDSIICQSPFMIWNDPDSCWVNKIRGVSINPFFPDDQVDLIVRFSSNNLGNLNDTLYFFSSAGNKKVMLKGSCVYNSYIDESQLTFKIFPNPCDKNIYLSCQQGPKNDIIIQITDLAGNNIYSMSLKSSGAVNTVRLNVEYLTDGMYILNILDRLNVSTFRFLVLH